MNDETYNRVLSHLKHFTKGEPSHVALRVAELLDRWQGLHHFDPAALRRCDWSNGTFIELTITKRRDPGGRLSTYDFDGLTTLVLLAHDLSIRVEISPCNNKCLALLFHPRPRDGGGMSRRHPTIEDALALWRRGNPAPKEATP